MIRLLAVLAALLLVSCASPAAPDDRWERPEQIDYAPSLGVDLAAMHKTESGLYWQDLVAGTGRTAGIGKLIRVYYTGWLPDGTVVDIRAGNEPPLEFRFGVGLVIRGWDEGIVGMQVGGKRRLVVPPSLAFRMGRPGTPPIPPLATLVYEIHLVWAQE